MSSLPTKVRHVPCDGRGCPACEHRGWALAPLLMDCPTCEGSTEVEGFRYGTGPKPLVTCPDCHGDGRVLRPCVMHDVDGCERPAVRWPEMGEPVCHEHDCCDACEEEWHGGGPTPPPPVLGERLCARHLAVVGHAVAA